MSTGDSFMTIEGVAGEAEDSEFPGSIEVLGWDWGIEMSASTGRADVGTNARADVKVFTFAHRFDAAIKQRLWFAIFNRDQVRHRRSGFSSVQPVGATA